MPVVRTSLALLSAAAALAACAPGGPPLGGVEGLQLKVMNHYDRHAMEENATCPQPRMTSARGQIVEETAERLVMNVRYHWRDEGQTDFDHDAFPPFGGAGSLNRCDGWGERTFTFVRNTAGGYDVESMTGPQRGRGGRA